MRCMRCFLRSIAPGLAIVMLSGALSVLGVVPVFAGTVITVSADRETTIYVSEVYDEAVGQLYNETTIGPDQYH